MIQIMPSSLGCFGALLGSVLDVLLFVLCARQGLLGRAAIAHCLRSDWLLAAFRKLQERLSKGFLPCVGLYGCSLASLTARICRQLSNLSIKIA